MAINTKGVRSRVERDGWEVVTNMAFRRVVWTHCNIWCCAGDKVRKMGDAETLPETGGETAFARNITVFWFYSTVHYCIWK